MIDIPNFLNIRSDLFKRLVLDTVFQESVENAGRVIKQGLKKGGKILIFGNGGSAAQAQHFAAELVCMFEMKRRALAAIALTTDSSVLTAQSNDFGFETVFSRQIEALCRKEDTVIGLTTSDGEQSGHSANLFNAFFAARKIGAGSIGLFSWKTKNLLSLVDAPIIVSNTNTALIQEAHQTIIHLLCSLVEKET